MVVLKADSRHWIISKPPVTCGGRKTLAASSSLERMARARLALYVERYGGTGVGMKLTVGTVV